MDFLKNEYDLQERCGTHWFFPNPQSDGGKHAIYISFLLFNVLYQFDNMHNTKE